MVEGSTTQTPRSTDFFHHDDNRGAAVKCALAWNRPVDLLAEDSRPPETGTAGIEHACRLGRSLRRE